MIFSIHFLHSKEYWKISDGKAICHLHRKKSIASCWTAKAPPCPFLPGIGIPVHILGDILWRRHVALSCQPLIFFTAYYWFTYSIPKPWTYHIQCIQQPLRMDLQPLLRDLLMFTQHSMIVWNNFLMSNMSPLLLSYTTVSALQKSFPFLCLSGIPR
jgi:hypothetical protein